VFKKNSTFRSLKRSYCTANLSFKIHILYNVVDYTEKNSYMFNIKYTLNNDNILFKKYVNKTILYRLCGKVKKIFKKQLKKPFKRFLSLDQSYNLFFFSKSINFFFLFLFYSLELNNTNFFKKNLDLFLLKPTFYETLRNQKTNLTPLTLMSEKIKVLIRKKNVSQPSEMQATFFRQYLGGLFEAVCSSRFFIRLIPFMDIPQVYGEQLFVVVKKYNYFQKIIGVGFFLGEMILLL